MRAVAPSPVELPAPRRLGEHAVVVGAGVAGLLCARALADFFERISLIESDALPAASASPRAGAPQGPHPHVLLEGGLRAMARLLPDLRERLERRGARCYDVGAELRVETPDGPWPREALGVSQLSVTRPVLESCLRDAVLARPEVTLRSEARVTSVVWKGLRAAGVRLCLSRGTTAEVAADLVVDASGLASLASRWLAEGGLPMPELSVARSHVRHVTRCFGVPTDRDAPLAALRAAVAPDQPRGVLLAPIEGERCLVSLSSRGDDAPPADLQGFRERLRSLSPAIHAALEVADPLGAARVHYAPASIRRHFERLCRRAEGLISIGDSLCCLNPIYGQGMSVAALQAGELFDELGERCASERDLRELPGAYFARAAARLETPWRLSVLPDLAFAQTEGERPKDLDAFLRALRGVERRAAEDLEARRLLVQVTHLLRPWNELFDADTLAELRAPAAP